MNIDIKIEQLVFQGTQLSPRQRRQVQTAIVAELSHLIATNGVPPHLQSGVALPHLPLTLAAASSRNPTHLGQQIAHSIYGGFTP